MTPSVQLSIVVPTFNEAANLAVLVEKHRRCDGRCELGSHLRG